MWVSYQKNLFFRFYNNFHKYMIYYKKSLKISPKVPNSQKYMHHFIMDIFQYTSLFCMYKYINISADIHQAVVTLKASLTAVCPSLPSMAW